MRSGELCGLSQSSHPTPVLSSPLTASRSSLLSLPDELLAHVVDQALDEYAPRLYEERQATARALSLVNWRVGAISQPRLVEVMHVECKRGLGPSPSRGRLHVNGVHILRVSHPPTFYGGPLERVLAPLSLTDFDALRDLRLVRVSGVQLKQISRFNGTLPQSSVDLSSRLTQPHMLQSSAFSSSTRSPSAPSHPSWHADSSTSQ